MATKENVPRKHHYIPKFYLRGFSDLGFGKEQGKVCVVDLRGKKHFTTSAENVAHVRDYYAFESEDGSTNFQVETKFFNGIDGKAAQIIGKINGLKKVTIEDDWDGLCRFIAALEVRTPSQRQTSYEMEQYVFDLMNGHLATSLEACEQRLKEAEEKTGEKVECTPQELMDYVAEYRVKIPQNEHVALMMSVIPQSEAIIRRMTPHLFIAGENERFITSDYPIVKIDTDEERRREGLMGVGWATPEVEAIIPLTKTHCLVLNWDGKPDVMTVNNQTVAYCNAAQLATSFQYAFAENDNFCFLTEDAGIVHGLDEAYERFSARKLEHRSKISGGGIERREPEIAPLKSE
jgi:hypothetical protein